MWHLIDSGFKNPYYNMAYDESIMNSIEDKDTVFLRFFNFKPASITIGYHQDVEDWLLRLEEIGVPWVRRKTGGRAVIHSNDCTYSLIFHRKNSIIGGNTIESYKKIARGFRKAFELLGINTEIKRGRPERSKMLNSHLCFSATSLAELTCRGKKIIGSAQFREKNRVMQQGTIMLEKPGKPFPPVSSMITVNQVSGGKVSLGKMKNSIIRGFEKEFSVKFSRYGDNILSSDLIKKYSSRNWNYSKDN